MIDRRLSRRIRMGLIVGLVVGGLWVAFEDRPDRALAQSGERPPPAVIAMPRPDAPNADTTALQPAAAVPERWALPAGAIDPKSATLIDGKLGQVLPDGTRVILTLDPRLQSVAQSTLERYKVEWGAVVAIRPQTGEILAFAEHADQRPNLSRLPLNASGPAASLFKMITSSALLEFGGVAPDSQICTHGGHHKLTLYNLKANERLDTKCETFAQALGSSNNVAFARWADEKLDPAQLQAMANRFLFGKRIPFQWAVGVSEARVPTGSRLGFARTAAGFENTTLSPLHAALITATIANDGTMMAPFLVREADKDGVVMFSAEPTKLAEVLSPEIAAKLRGMLEETVTSGTGRKFFEKKGAKRLPVRAGGKSGSLSAKDDGVTRNYSWFVAFAPIDNPQIAVAALVVNGAEWTVKGAVPAREVLDAYFDRDVAPDPAAKDPLAAP